MILRMQQGVSVLQARQIPYEQIPQYRNGAMVSVDTGYCTFNTYIAYLFGDKLYIPYEDGCRVFHKSLLMEVEE